MRLQYIIPILFFMLAWGNGYSQVTADISEVDFGEINRSTDRVIDITLTNSDDQPAFLLRYGFPPEYLVIMSDKTIPPGGTATLRVKFNPQIKGSVKDPVDLWFSNMDKPVHLVFEANVLYIDHSDNPACPSFNERPANCCNDEPALVEVFDRSNGKPISGARVRIIQQGTLQQTMIMDRQGGHELDAPIAYYYLIADAREYFPTDTAMYINRRNNHIRLLLDPAPKTTEVETLAVQEPEQPETPDDVVEEVTIRIEKDDQPTTDPNPPPLPRNEDANLPESLYSRNNVVILVDVSQSMNQGGKMDLLKASVLGLSDVIRDVDNVSLITYASQSNIVIEKATGREREVLQKSTRELQAGGMTAGAKGFKAAFELAMAHFIEGGNNQVIVATDGAFRAADQAKIDKLVRKYRKKGVTTSVIGIKSTSGASKILDSIAREGEGSFIYMEDFDASQQQLVEEIKSRSFKIK